MTALFFTALCAAVFGSLALGALFTEWLMRGNDRDVDSYGAEIDR